MKKGIATVLSVLMVPYCLVPFCTVPTAADALDASPVVTVEYINIEREIPKVTTIVTTIPTTTTEIATTTETITEVTTITAVSSEELTEEQIVEEVYSEVVYEEPYIEEVVEETLPPVTEVPVEPESEPVIFYDDDWVCPYSDWEIDLLARLTTSEDGLDPANEWGRRMVIDTVLNRIDHPAFGCSTISEVIYAPYQFSCASYIYNFDAGDNVRLVKEELQNRSNYDVHYFWGGQYPPYGTRLFEAGGNYFTTINY